MILFSLLSNEKYGIVLFGITPPKGEDEAKHIIIQKVNMVTNTEIKTKCKLTIMWNPVGSTCKKMKGFPRVYEGTIRFWEGFNTKVVPIKTNQQVLDKVKISLYEL